MFVCPECGYSAASAGFCTEHGSGLVPAHDPLLGQTVGSYRIAKMVGQGGMGRVYLAVQPTIGSRVAIKVLSAECAERPDLVERFFAEARAVNVIRHESIVSVLDLARLPDGRPYIVMEYLDGVPLTRLIERGQLPLEQAVRLISEVLDALSAAHARQIVHRDLKPDNVFVTAGGRAKVLDFGVAKLRPDVSALSAETRTGALVGTPHYMSPEQARGRTVDARSDLYAVGLILLEALTGRRAFDADSLFDLLRLHVEQPAPPLRALRPDAPAMLEVAVSRALEKEPERRFQSADAFRQALFSALPWSGSHPGMRIDTAALAPTQPTPPLAPTHPGYTQSLITATPARSHSSAFRWGLLAAGTLVALGAITGGVLVVWTITRPDPIATPTPPPVPTVPAVPSPGVPATSDPKPGPSLAGTYTIELGENPGGAGSYAGNVLITERATDLYTMDWTIPNSPSYHGVALRQGSVLAVAWGPGQDYGVVAYTVRGGRLEGRWALASGSDLGSETIDGAPGLSGNYRIVEGKNPGSGTRYAGSVEISPTAGGAYRVSWQAGNSAYRGVGLHERDTFVVAWNPKRGTGVVAYAINGERLVGRWTLPGTPGIGRETLRRR